ncbi:uncharacterized protein YecT (DUF1311 family) [Rhodovulum bhavnagarense]|uniref:Uncharacterized protein YecT (DUF1311 family) n=1 Tax=Rhodovulum bhavnagarense TaxID=992286 RepID=A0A4R2R689_9RHOB|nr:lysozyme inhibitor LprI family protein [Rhodovulum bhavnagarense]TCP58540.1 uncharacterized protein YecT (DUF1311 family) [Rhodovulum bhavnagarense]
MTISITKTLAMKGILGPSVLAAGLIAGAAAGAEPVFTPTATEACVNEAYRTSPGLSGHAVLDCVGRAAGACMMTPGGDTTVGMMVCLDGELGYWDARLNAAYAGRIAVAREQDAEMREIGSAASSIEESLRAMQRAWIPFRDASCLYEQAQWMGGTGGGPATLACHMHETARQALKLEGWWGQ